MAHSCADAVKQSALQGSLTKPSEKQDCHQAAPAMILIIFSVIILAALILAFVAALIARYPFAVAAARSPL